MKVAIIHYWLIGMRGGEKVIESLCRLFPDADIYTHVYDSQAVSKTIRRHHVRTTFIAHLPFSRQLYKKYLPLMPLALEELDLQKYDLVISSESGPAKGVITRPDATHICYVHSPMRYIWDQYQIYKMNAGFMTRLLMPLMTHKLRIWDVTSASRVDSFISNSTFVAKRIQKYYRRDSIVIHPPVAVEDFMPVHADELSNYYLWVGELVSYKRPDIVVDAFNKLRIPLVVIGDGDMLNTLKKNAENNISFLGKVSFASMKYHMARCKALVSPGTEDFGIIPVEVMASGRPVIAYGKGGVVDTIENGVTGLLFYEQTSDALIEAVEIFESSLLSKFPPDIFVTHANNFNQKNFQDSIKKLLAENGFNIDN